MLKSSARTSVIRMSILAGVAALAMGDLAGSAQAFPRLAAAPGAETATMAIRYDGDDLAPRRHRHMRHSERYGENAHPAHPGHAGLYDCGPGGVRTRLSRKACGGGNRFQHLQQAY